MNEEQEIVKIIERAIKVGEKRAMSIEKSGFLSDHPSSEELAIGIIGALKESGYSLSKNGQLSTTPVEMENLT